MDEVSEVLNITRDHIEPAPAFGGGMEEADFITGMGRLAEKVVILLDIDRVLEYNDLAEIVEAAAQ